MKNTEKNTGTEKSVKPVHAEGAMCARRGSLRMITVTGILAAMGAVLMALEFPVPFMPSFVKFDFSELPALLATFSMGPVSGVLVCLVKNLIHLPFGSTGGVGELCNFLLGVCFVLPAGILYKLRKNRRAALIGSLGGAVAMALCSVPLNYFISYPVYTKFLPLDAIIGMYQELLPGVNGLLQCLVIFNLPFTFVKGMIDTAVCFAVYKRISPIIKK